MSINRRPLSIHIWGGYGSQLYALALAHDVRQRFKFFNILLEFHSSGVTRRLPDFDLNLIDFQSVLRDDFTKLSSGANFSTFKPQIGSISRNLIKSVFNRTGIVCKCNSDLEFKSIGRFTKQIRGHYSWRSIKLETLDSIYKMLYMSTESRFKDSIDLVVHVRLGDLIYLDDKSPTDAFRFLSIIQNLIDSKEVKSVTIFSDSPKEAKDIILTSLQSSDHCQIVFPDVNIYEAVFAMIWAPYFIGTSSKITEWATLFRELNRNKRKTWVPKELEEFSVRNNISNIILYN